MNDNSLFLTLTSLPLKSVTLEFYHQLGFYLIRYQNMKLRIILLSLSLGLILSSCAYYNTFYNAEKAFKEAARERAKKKTDQITPQEKQKYDK
ncbi:MAG: hypothetical protein ONB05_09985, partial [candidate division KSB1 bacterium]|nr:hypothetical protein [candidate division KSB1 bacterium]